MASTFLSRLARLAVDGVGAAFPRQPARCAAGTQNGTDPDR